MRADLLAVRQLLTREGEPLGRVAELIAASLESGRHGTASPHDLVGETIR